MRCGARRASCWTSTRCEGETGLAAKKNGLLSEPAEKIKRRLQFFLSFFPLNVE
jgi:hypothetical protein